VERQVAATGTLHKTTRDRNDAAAAVGGKEVTTVTTSARAVAAPALIPED
jgi:hypothetical protein